jgi:hypothetical protein
LTLYNVWWYTIIGYYRRRNYTRSLEFAIQKEKEWDAIKPKEEEEEEYGEEVAPVEAEAAESAPAEESAAEEDE